MTLDRLELSHGLMGLLGSEQRTAVQLPLIVLEATAATGHHGTPSSMAWFSLGLFVARVNNQEPESPTEPESPLALESPAPESPFIPF